MNLDRLLAPRSVAVVGASPRPSTYGNQAIANLITAGFDGPIWGVHPTADEVLGVPCVRSLSDLDQAPDAIVIATPAATVPAIIEEAGAIRRRWCRRHRRRFRGGRTWPRVAATAARCSASPQPARVRSKRQRPCFGSSTRTALGRRLQPRSAGAVALVSQSGNVAVNALGTRRALRLHTIVSCGNQAVLDASDYLIALAEQDGVRSVALYLETEGDGARLTEGLAACAERSIGVVVLKAGRSALGASAAAAHTGAVAGDAPSARGPRGRSRRSVGRRPPRPFGDRQSHGRWTAVVPAPASPWSRAQAETPQSAPTKPND